MPGPATDSVDPPAEPEIVELVEEELLPRDQLRQAGEGPAILTAESRVVDMHRRLKEIGAPIYGRKSEVWTRLQREEGRVRRELEIAEAQQVQRER